MNPNKSKKVKTVSMGLSNLSPKTTAAVVLVSLMAILWGRVLLTGKNGPKAADAQPDPQAQPALAMAQQPTDVAAAVIGVELSFQSGRHDRLTSDLFSADQWKAFEFHEKEEQAVVPVVEVKPQEDPLEKIRKAHQGNLDKIAQTLALEAVIDGADGKPCKAFVNEKILAVGSVLTVQEGPETYELTLTELSEKEALFTWNEFSMVLRITESVH